MCRVFCFQSFIKRAFLKKLLTVHIFVLQPFPRLAFRRFLLSFHPVQPIKDLEGF